MCKKPGDSVLFVDDEEGILKGFMLGLRKEPYKILTAISASDALEILSESRVDVVVSDERMPGMSGSELLSEIRRKYPDVIRIMLTGQISLEAAINAINEGEVYRLLTKPCSLVDLSCTIRQALQIKRLANESHRLLKKTRGQQDLLTDLEESHPGITQVQTDTKGAVILDNIDSLIKEIENETTGSN